MDVLVKLVMNQNKEEQPQPTWCVRIRGAGFLAPSKAENWGNAGSSLAADRNDINDGAAPGLPAQDQSIAGAPATPPK
jgi:hypothetical protein